MSIHARAHDRAQQLLTAEGVDQRDQLNGALRLLGKYRTMLAENTYLARHGTTVMFGPFAGMEFVRASAEGCHVPKLFGCYEQPLHPHIEAAISAGYAAILNIGCAEGYYAVGMARRAAGATIHAYDLNEDARTACAALAGKNGVSDRISIGELFTHADFAAFAEQRTLVLCDIEGAEAELLDPDKAPALRQMDLIVEAHECMRAGLTAELIGRFGPTHHITVVQDDGLRRLPEPPAWFYKIPSLDQLLCTWEWRTGPTPWLVMTARSDPA